MVWWCNKFLFFFSLLWQWDLRFLEHSYEKAVDGKRKTVI